MAVIKDRLLQRLLNRYICTYYYYNYFMVGCYDDVYNNIMRVHGVRTELRARQLRLREQLGHRSFQMGTEKDVFIIVDLFLNKTRWSPQITQRSYRPFVSIHCGC